jgi:hypothetical protein
MSNKAARLLAASVCSCLIGSGLIHATPGSDAAGGQTHDPGFLYPIRRLEVSQPHYPHLSITIRIERAENWAVENGGIDAFQYWVSWAFQSDVATNIPVQMPAWPFFPEVNVPFDFGAAPHIVYRGEVPNGCNSHVNLGLRLRMYHKPETVADVTMSDHITGHGYYSVYIPVLATEGNQASQFVFLGRLDAVCTNVLH